MKLIHCADIHLGSKMETNLSKDKAKQRKDEIFESFVNMVNYANVNSINHIMISGDLIDNKSVSNTVIRRLLQVVLKYENINFYYLEGNHDAHIFDSIDTPRNLHIFKDTFKRIDIGEISIGGLSTNKTEEISFDKEKYNILMLHGNVVKYNSQNLEDIYLNNFENLNVNYFALGHIHKKETYMIDKNSIAVYSGCLEGRGFDELGDKGFYVLDIVNNELSLEFVDVSKRKFLQIEVDITGLKDYEEIFELINKKISNISKDNLYKVVLTGYYDIQIEKRIDKITEKLNEIYYFVKIEDNSKLKIDYKDYENDISLLGEFVRTVLENKELDTKDKDKILEYGIKALKNEEI